MAIAGSICALLLSACADRPATPEVPSATVQTAPATTATTATTNPYDVPAVIDVAYVNRVLAWLDQFEGDIARSIMSSRSLKADDVARLRAIHASDGAFQVALDAIQFDIRSGFSGALPNPGATRTVVIEILSAKSSCIYVKVDRDYTAVASNPNPSLRTQWVALRRIDPPISSYNATGWGYQLNGGAFGARPTAPATDPCVPF
jgi:hypothetical protein